MNLELFTVAGMLLMMVGVVLGVIIAPWLGRRQSIHQIASARGGSVVIQTGSNVKGDLVGGDLIKNGGAAGRCQYCGASQ